MQPYIDIYDDDDYLIRQFDENIDPIELMWHRDKENRIVQSVSSTDWKVQLDNSLPISLNESIFIPKYVWHRVIKGTGNLQVKIYEK